MLSTVEVVQMFLARLAAQDAQGIACLCAPTVEWEAPGPNGARWTTGPRTRREVESQFLALFALFGLERLSARQVIVDGGDAAVVGSARWRVLASAERVDVRFAAVVSVRLGEIEQFWQMPDTLVAAVATGAARAEV